MEAINNVVLAVSNFLYQPFILPVILLVGGLYFTIRTGGVQIRMFRDCLRVVTEKPKTENGISSFGALMVSTASRVGTGNIIGVATAVICGGSGAIFWMWLSAFLGGASAFIESTLAQIYKKKNADGSSYGGPAFYMRDALNARWLGVIFSVLIIFTYAIGYNMLAAFNLQSTFKVFSFYGDRTPAIIGVILAALFGAVVIGGAHRLVKVTGVLVPVMGIIYVAISLIVLVLNIGNVPAMFAGIFKNAFDFQAIFGGFAGSCIMFGIKRGLYSNEAGMVPHRMRRQRRTFPTRQAGSGSDAVRIHRYHADLHRYCVHVPQHQHHSAELSGCGWKCGCSGIRSGGYRIHTWKIRSYFHRICNVPVRIHHINRKLFLL